MKKKLSAKEIWKKLLKFEKKERRFYIKAMREFKKIEKNYES